MEKKKPLLVLRGGGIVGGAVKFYPTFPLVSLRLDEDRIVLRVWPLREHTIPLADVETITLIQRPRFLYIPSVRMTTEVKHLRILNLSAYRPAKSGNSSTNCGKRVCALMKVKLD